MKKFLIPFLSVFAIGAAAANPMFGDGHENSVTLSAGTGIGSGSMLKLVYPGDWELVPMTMIMGTYSQPMTIFKIPARMNATIVQNIAYHSADGLSFIGVGLSWDVVAFDWNGWYVGAGLGPYYRDNHDRWVSSRLVFGEKFFIGKNITDDLRLEMYTLHFSNGDLTETNRGFNFWGVSVGYSF
ncbi:MAG: acyloxyacyl hydrolase [Alphaproteobacteria bacterium]|nr:acyloxyacyl hydrolase [Alphaproteobacteria bacterium]